MSKEFKIVIATTLVCIVAVIARAALLSQDKKTITKDQLIEKDTQIAGQTDSKIYLVEFSDFECPACALFQPVFAEIKAKHSDKMQIAFRHFPLAQHSNALYAAYASEAAAKQGKFWEMHDYLFKQQTNLSSQIIDNGAEFIGLNIEQYKKDVVSQEVKDKVARDIETADSLGVNSTPTFYLNGEKLYLRTTEDLLTAVNKVINEEK